MYRYTGYKVYTWSSSAVQEQLLIIIIIIIYSRLSPHFSENEG